MAKKNKAKGAHFRNTPSFSQMIDTQIEADQGEMTGSGKNHYRIYERVVEGILIIAIAAVLIRLILFIIF